MGLDRCVVGQESACADVAFANGICRCDAVSVAEANRLVVHRVIGDPLGGVETERNGISPNGVRSLKLTAASGDEGMAEYDHPKPPNRSKVAIRGADRRNLSSARADVDPVVGGDEEFDVLTADVERTAPYSPGRRKFRDSPGWPDQRRCIAAVPEPESVHLANTSTVRRRRSLVRWSSEPGCNR